MTGHPKEWGGPPPGPLYSAPGGEGADDGCMSQPSEESSGDSADRGPESGRGWPLLAPLVVALFLAYFLLPEHTLGPERPELSWTVFGVATAIALLLLVKHMRDALFDRPGTVVALVSLMRPSVPLVLLRVLRDVPSPR